MPAKRFYTAFARSKPGILELLVLEGKPIKTDWDWGRHKRAQTEGAQVDIFYRGVEPEPEALKIALQQWKAKRLAETEQKQ